MLDKTLAHYEILEKLGAGGMGEVYRARDTKLDREVALKVLPEKLAENPDRRKRFQREAKAIAALKHPNIVTIYSVEETDGITYLTMELVEGETLAELIPAGGMKLDKFFDVAIPLADAIGSAHTQNITHRDLKPANIMLDHEGRVKVLDFGLAKLLDPAVDVERAKTVVQSGDTAVGQVLGTAAYMSPEQAEAKTIDHRSDIFSLGIIFYEMATGQKPFTGDTSISIISSILKDSPASISTINQVLPRHLGRMVSQCLEKNPEKRFQSAKDIRNELENLQKEIDSGDLTMTAEMAVANTSSKSMTRFLPWAIVGIVVVAGVIFMTRTGGRDQSASRPDVSVSASSRSSATTVAEDSRKMTVVLPFENLGPPEEAYFAAGMTEEITTRLASVSGMGVISRTSAVQYDRTGKTLKQIGEDLGVDYVLEGTVRWAKKADGTGRVRITPQLIRVSDDTHVWTDTYDRELDDIFEVQTDIATHVIDELGVTLLGGEEQLVGEKPTDNLEAYQLYLQADNMEFGNISDLDLKAELLEKAVALDPNFVAAWYELARQHSDTYRTLDRTEERLLMARKAIEGAEAVDKDHHLTRLARGYYYYYGFQEYDRAVEEFLAASKAVPNNSDARASIGYIRRRQGDWQGCIDNLKAAMALDPQNTEYIENLAGMYDAMREHDEAIRLYDRAISIDPDNIGAISKKANIYARGKGDLGAARRALGTISDKTNPQYLIASFFLRLMEGDYANATTELMSWEDESPFAVILKGTFASISKKLAGDPDAEATAKAASQMMKQMLKEAPGNSLLRGFLSSTYAIEGRAADAVREAKLAVDLTNKDVFSGPQSLENLAGIYSMVGREEEAIDLLERLLNTTYEDAITIHHLKMSPQWDSLRGNPRFQALLKPNV